MHTPCSKLVIYQTARCLLSALFCSQLSCQRDEFWSDPEPGVVRSTPDVEMTDCNGGGATREEVEAAAALRLEFGIAAKRLDVRVTNVSKAEARIWEWFMSWGYYQYRFHIKDPDSENVFTIERKPTDFVRNAPVFFTLAPGACKKLSFELNESWTVPTGLLGMRGQALLIQAELLSEPCREATEESVFVGSIRSEWVQIAPPQDWY